MPGAEPISYPASSLFTGFFRVLTCCQNPIICIRSLYYTTFYTTFPLNTPYFIKTDLLSSVSPVPLYPAVHDCINPLSLPGWYDQVLS